MSHPVNIVVVGLGFGAEFAPIYSKHPDVGRVGICEPDTKRLNQVGDRHDIEDRFSSFEDVLADDRFNAVHLLTPVPFHVEQTLKVLGAGKHCACAVPMATTIEDIQRIIEAQKASQKNYMMMETAAYDRFLLYADELYRNGSMGNITFMRGTYFQDLEGDFPRYWRGVPPMHYSTHVVSPMLALAQTVATEVCCFGSGRLRDDIQLPGGNTFPLQTAIFRLANSDVAVEVTRSWFQVARSSTEAFSVYGDKLSFEWQQLEHEDPVLYKFEPVEPGRRGRPVLADRIDVPYRSDLYPAELREFERGWHGGSHPHLAHEFVRSIVESRPPRIDAATSANWTAPGICANDSSLLNGRMVKIPAF
jgi:predicted dehydrogenase